MAVLGCRSIVLVIRIIIRKRWRNLGFSQSAENFENIYVILQKTIEYLNTIKRYSGRLFIKFERNKGIVLKFHFLGILLRFSQTFWLISIMNH